MMPEMPESIRRDRERNHRDNLEYIDRYADWVLRTPNEVWSEVQKRLIDSVLASSRDFHRRHGTTAVLRELALRRRRSPR